MTLILQTPPAYDPAPWYVRWLWEVLTALPAGISVTLGILFVLGYLLRNRLTGWMEKIFDALTDRIKRSSKEPTPTRELTRKATKAVIVEQLAERLRMQLGCDHVSVYGCQNGEYLRSGEGVDKFVMQAEATHLPIGRYMDIERTVFAQDIPRLVLSLGEQPYVLIWAGRHDDWKVNKMMSERGYTSTVACFIRRPVKPGATELGVIGMFAVSWFTCEVYRPDQAQHLPATHKGETRLLDAEMEQLLLSYAQEFSYTM